jgi:hypothetical protein
MNQIADDHLLGDPLFSVPWKADMSCSRRNDDLVWVNDGVARSVGHVNPERLKRLALQHFNNLVQSHSSVYTLSDHFTQGSPASPGNGPKQQTRSRSQMTTLFAISLSLFPGTPT